MPYMPMWNADKWALVPTNQSKILNEVNIMIGRLERVDDFKERMPTPAYGRGGKIKMSEDGMAHQRTRAYKHENRIHGADHIFM